MFPEIKVGSKLFKIRRDEMLTTDTGCIGEIRYNRCEIILAHGLDEQTETETIAHEAVHAMLAFMGEDKINNDENSVNRIANGLMMLVADNPELFRSIIKR